jgi:radical SAM protein with 4Fe4S-binding SPASM domain
MKLYQKFSARGGRPNPLPIGGSFELTLRCNVRCKHCYILVPGATSNEMNTEQVFSVLQKLADGGALFLLLSGGEILARPDFKEIYLHTKKLGIMPTCFTNATLVNEDIVEFWAAYPPRRVEVTIYGHSEDVYEAVTGVKGSYKRFRRGVQLMKEAGIPMLLKTMVLKTNQHEFLDIRQWVLDQGIPFRYDITLNPKLDHDPSPLAERLDPREHVEIENIDPDVNFEDFGEKLEMGMGLPARDDLFTCGAGIRTFHVDPQGRLHPCMLWRKNPYDLLHRDLDENWRRHIHDLRATRVDTEGCNSCSNRGVCGRCTASALLEMGDPTKPIPHMCEVSQERRKRFGEPKPLQIQVI